LHRKMGDPPHFAEFYYDERRRVVSFHSMTERGFRQLLKDFNSFGYNFTDTPFLVIRHQIIPTTEDILQVKIELDEFPDHFMSDPDPEADDMVQKMNKLMELLLPDFNAGKTPDLEAAAKIAGLPMETAEDLYKAVSEKFGEMPPVPGTAKVMETGSHGKGSKPKIIPANVWSSIYQYAREIRLMRPWEKLHETDVFGIRIPGTDRIYFISVMGSIGEFFALSAYKGYESFFKFFELQEKEDKAHPTDILTIHHLMLSFLDRKEMEKEDLDAIRKSGESFRGKKSWPRLEEIVQGYFPAFPEGESLDDLPVLLEQAVWVLSKAVIDPDFLNYGSDSDEKVYVRTPTGPATKPKWNTCFELPEPEKFQQRFDIKYSYKSAAKVSKKKVSDTVLQVELFLLPNAVKEPGTKPHFPFVMLFVEKESGMVAGMRMLSPVPDLKSMYEIVPEKILEKLGEMPYRPAWIEMRSELLYNITEKALNEAWCKTRLQEEMPGMDEAINSLMENLNRSM
jgi:hypothetical protein